MNIFEKNAGEFQLFSPISQKQEQRLYPKKIKANSPESYNQNGVNFTKPLKPLPPHPETKDIVLVKDPAALKFLVKSPYI